MAGRQYYQRDNNGGYTPYSGPVYPVQQPPRLQFAQRPQPPQPPPRYPDIQRRQGGRQPPPPPRLGRISLPPPQKPAKPARVQQQPRRDDGPTPEQIIRRRKRRHQDLVNLWVVVEFLIMLAWPLMMLIPAFTPGTLSWGATTLLIAAAVAWVVAFVLMRWFTRQHNNGSLEARTWTLGFALVAFVLVVVFTSVAWLTGVTPCPGTKAP